MPKTNAGSELPRLPWVIVSYNEAKALFATRSNSACAGNQTLTRAYSMLEKQIAYCDEHDMLSQNLNDQKLAAIQRDCADAAHPSEPHEHYFRV